MAILILALVMIFWSKYLNAIRKALNKPEYEIDDLPVYLSVYLGTILLIVVVILTFGNYYINRRFAARYEADPCGIYRVNDEIAKHREFEHDPIFGIIFLSRIANFPTVDCSSNPPKFTPRNTSPE